MDLENIHSIIGSDHCANVDCLAKLGYVHIIAITTGHTRHFCGPQCMIDGEEAYLNLSYSTLDTDPAGPGREDPAKLAQVISTLRKKAESNT